MTTTSQQRFAAVPSASQSPPSPKAQGYSVAVVNRLEALVSAPDGTTSIFSATIEIVTPPMAEAYLAKMRPNRKIRDGRVTMWAGLMEAEKWRLTNQGIAFDSDGYLIDGQHRLWGVIRSGKPVAFLVVRGLPTAAQNLIDGGTPRKAGDQFDITFATRDGKQRVAIARVIHLLRTGWAAPTQAIPTEEAFAQIERYRAEIEWALGVFPSRRAVAPAPVVGAWCYAYPTAPEQIAEFADSYVNGAGLDRGDPLLLLREHVISVGATGDSTLRMEMALKAARAIWARMNGESVKRLYASTEGLLGLAANRGDPIAPAWAWHSVR